MIRTYQYRLNPTPQQQALLKEIFDAARWLYNRALDFRRQRWNESRYSVTYNEQAAMWKAWRNEQPEDNPLRLLGAHAGQQVLRRLDSAYSAFKQGQRGRPRFKGWRFFRTIAYTVGSGAGLQNGRLYVQNVGLIAVRWHRDLPEGTIKQVLLTCKPSGWYASFQVECAAVEIEPSENPAVGVDMGIHHALALSDGTLIDKPPHLKWSLARLRRLQRKVARREKGSAGRKEAVDVLAKEHEHIANQRRDYWHKVTFWLVAIYGVIVLEKLNLAFMLRNDKLARAAHDVGLGLFQDILDYKAIQAGVGIVLVNPRDTSQQCNGCPKMVPKDLSVRIHACPHCGFTVDRDVNVALNILGLGRETASKR